MSYTDRFNAQGINPARVPYRRLVMTVSEHTAWPAFADDNYLADIMDVSTVAAGPNLYLPDAREGSPGAVTLVKNVGAFAFDVLTFNGTPVANVLPGQAKYIYLTANATQDGVWDVTIFGVGAASIDVVGAAGAGLIATGAQLAIGKSISVVTASRSITEADRAQILVWTGGTGTLTLPLSSTVRPFNVEVRNQGAGSLTLAAAGGETIDGSASLVMGVGEAFEVNAGEAAWYTVGRGRTAQFNYTLLTKTVSAGVVTLSLTEAANVVQRYIGVLVANVDVVLPAVVQVYYVTNATTGAFNLRFRNPGVGTTVSIPQGQSAVLFSDGTNVINQATTIAGLSSIIFAPGSAGATPIGINASNTGFYQSAVNEIGVSSNGSQVAAFDAAGLRVIGGTPRVAVESGSGAASLFVRRPAGQVGSLYLQTGTNLRWGLGVDGAAEGGANAGSNFFLNTYDDAGAFLRSAVTIERATGYATARGMRDLSKVGQLAQFVGSTATAHPFCLMLAGGLVSRTAYPELFAYAQSTGLVSEADWAAGQNGRFSVGDGSTTFRLPDLRGVFLRGLDDGRGLDAGRLWGVYQDQAVTLHNHGINDPGHNHNINDPSHNHGVSDGGHNHSGTTDVQGNHDHRVFGQGGAGGGNTSADFWVAAIINNIFGEKRTDGNGAHAHNFNTSWNGSNIGIFGNFTGITIQSRVTGITVQNTGGTDGRPRNMAYPYFIYY